MKNYRRIHERGKHSRQSPGQVGGGRDGKNKAKPSDAPILPVNGGFGECWCGEQYGHDWEGRSEGKPHPR